MNNIETLRQVVTPIPEVKTEEINEEINTRLLKRLGTLPEVNARLKVVQETQILRDNGFLFTISDKAIQKFKYHAGINKPYRTSHTNLNQGLLVMAFLWASVPIVLAIVLQEPKVLLFLFLSGLLTFVSADIQSTTSHWEVYYRGHIPNFALDRMDAIERLLPNTRIRFTVHSHQPMPVDIVLQPPLVDPVLIAHIESMNIVVAVWDNDKELEL